MWISKQTTILGSFISHRSWYSPALADRAPAATKLGQLPAVGGAGLCLGLSGMPISGWAAVPGFSWLPFVYASFHLASGQAPDLLRSPLFPSSYLEGGLPRPSFFSFWKYFHSPPTREDLAPPELRPAFICTVSGVFLPRKTIYFEENSSHALFS